MDEFLHNSARVVPIFFILFYLSSKLDFWKEPSVVGEDAHVMIAKGKLLDDFRERLRAHNVTTRLMINDVNEWVRLNINKC